MYDPTTDPRLRSFLDVPADSPFPIQNLPFGVFSTPGTAPRIGVAIGEYVLDLAELESRGLLSMQTAGGVFCRSSLNAFLAAGRREWTSVRDQVSRLLSHDEPRLRDDAALRPDVLHPQADVTLHLPVEIGDYTDFYSSREHATNVGTMLRGADNALQPNWLHLQVAYHGRASSIVLDGTAIHRPWGQTEGGKFGPTKALDFELELGFFIGPGNPLGQPIPIADAAEHIFGMVLVNDWSARDIQRWEYVPLGPFLSKSFATTISPWVVPLAALAPFRVAGPPQDPRPLPYLCSSGNWSLDIELEVLLATAENRQPQCIARSNFRHLYWNVAQQLAHHTIAGCNLRPGDLLASGTVSGPEPASRGSLLELAWRGERPVELPGGERRSFLADGDTVILRGWCQGDGYRVGFGEARGTILPPRELPFAGDTA
jgi:fumarylacetoacetase